MVTTTEDPWQLIQELGPWNVQRDEYGFPSAAGDRMAGYMRDYDLKSKFRRELSYAIPDREVLQAIADFVGTRKLLEVGAGSGLWARLLNDAGVQVTATDSADPLWNEQRKVGKWYLVQKLDYQEALGKYDDHEALMLCWPPYMEPLAIDALELFTGDRLVYIGEGESGCTGDEEFHKRR